MHGIYMNKCWSLGSRSQNPHKSKQVVQHAQHVCCVGVLSAACWTYMCNYAGCTFDIKNGEDLVYVPSSNLAACRKDVLDAALPLLNMKLQHAILCCHIVYFLDVDLTQVLNVYWPALHHNMLLETCKRLLNSGCTVDVC